MATLGVTTDTNEVDRLVEGLMFVIDGSSRPGVDPIRARDESIRSCLAFFEAIAAQGPLVLGLADLVAAWLDGCGVTTPITFVGASLGGMVGVAFAVRHPDRVRRLGSRHDPLRVRELHGGIEHGALAAGHGVHVTVPPQHRQPR